MALSSSVLHGRSALIGHTGLVGGNLARQFAFDDVYNSSNIDDIRSKHYQLLVCSGARGTKWIANQYPERDEAEIELLLNNLTRARVEYLILISTVDVFGVPELVNEDSLVDSTVQTPYGRHRHFIERTVCDHFPRILIVRLPALFGPGLKKNALYDLMSNHEVHRIHPDSVYQFYGLEHIWRDIKLAVAADLQLVHFATPPIRIGDLACELFDRNLTEVPERVSPALYDFRTKFDYVFGGAGGYLTDQTTVLEEIRAFVQWNRGRTDPCIATDCLDRDSGAS